MRKPNRQYLFPADHNSSFSWRLHVVGSFSGLYEANLNDNDLTISGGKFALPLLPANTLINVFLPLSV